MFCEKCGNKLPDMADFCPKCGNEFDNNMNQNVNSIIGNSDNYDKNTVLLEVRPSFKFSYVVLPKLLKELIYIIPIVVIMIYFTITISKMTTRIETSSSIGFSLLIPFFIFFVSLLFRLVCIMGKAFFDKKQYENYVYTFYHDRIIIKDSFMNVSEKELKYKYIREITKRQTFIQRYFNIGNIALFSNAESGFASGVFMINIENVDEVYQKVKEIINV